MKYSIFFCLLSTISISAMNYDYEESQTTRQIKKYNLIEWLRQDFKDNIIKKLIGNNSNNLKQFQTSILKGRNAECLFNKYGDLDKYGYELNEKNKENMALNYQVFTNHWNNSTARIEMKSDKKIVEYFNNMVLTNFYSLILN